MSTREQLESRSFLSGANGAFVAELFRRYKEDPKSVDASWRSFFAELGDDARAVMEDLGGPSWAPRANGGNGRVEPQVEVAPTFPQALAREPAAVDEVRAAVLDSLRALMLIRAYRVRGHLLSNLDPLGLEGREDHPELDYRTYGFTEADLDREIFINNVLGFESATLRQIVDRVKATYSSNIGVEYMHIQEPDQKAWIQERIEAIHNRTEFTKRGRVAILERLTASEGFERFLDKKFTGTKRFGLDGGESTIPALEQIMKRGGALGLKEIVIGMPHRGRLNVLANMMGKPYQAIFAEFLGGAIFPEDVGGSGDVKYHLGTSSDREFDGNTIHLSLTANPSHLEAVNPVAVGKVRAKQTRLGDEGRDQVMCLLLHGDAAFAGQGLVAETLDLSELKGYRTGGTIHFIVNNQIGFTTNPVHARSGPYCSEVAKIVQAPIFHVNGDDPEAAVHVARIAMEFRQRFKKDVVIDMFCYRRHGHNEGDEPAFTQPLMYRKIADHPTTRQIYARKLIADGVIDEERAEAIYNEFQERLEADFEAANSYRPNKADWLEGAWTGLEPARGEYKRGETSVPAETLREIGKRLTTIPDGFHANRKIERIFKNRAKSIEDGKGIDWSTAESLAFGTLLAETTPVRLSGQDSGRGTFSQRHAVLVDQESEARYLPLQNVAADQAMFEVIDSPLAEMSVLGFEYGYSLAEPHALVLWEAQFGDFANGAQVIIDQFICSGESKWLRLCGLVLLLPHGYEGQGPEHSSARLERFLQLSGEDNWQVANCTTPANYFHILRRQVRRKYRKPLVLMTPKSLLRHKLAVSKLDDMAEGTSFHRVLWDDGQTWKDDKMRRIVLCSGKVYYDLFEERAERGIEDVVLLRLEQLYPFPHKSLVEELGRYPQAELIWCQEESENMGAWSYIAPRLQDLFGKPFAYAGRDASASPAVGVMALHKLELERLLEDAFTL